MQSLVVVGLALDKAQLGLDIFRKQARPGAEAQGKDEQLQLIDQPSASMARTSVPLPLT